MRAHPFVIALQFLTRLPIRLSGAPSAAAQARSLLWYPLVGALFGAVLVVLAALLHGLPSPVRAAALLAFWALASGLLHLDGLADCADAWLGGHGDRERTLAIMKDPRAGPAAIVVLLLVLLLKFTAVAALLDDGRTLALLLAPLLARSALLPLLASTPYVRAGGLGSALAAHLDRRAAWLVTLAVALGTLLAPGGWRAVLAAGAMLLAVRALAQRRLGGFTGDVAGALVELGETAVLLALL